MRTLTSTIKFHSSYKEVRANVDPNDGPVTPVETFRSYLFAFIWIVVGFGSNEFFSHGVVTIRVNTFVVQMFLYLFCKIWEKHIPCMGITIKCRNYAINIDSSWSQKEQMF